MNTNGRHPIRETSGAKSGAAVAYMGIAALLFCAFLCGALAMLLAFQPALVNMVAACLAR